MKPNQMVFLTGAVACAAAITLLAGCASTKVSNAQTEFTGPLPKPNEIWVYDFTADPAAVPADSELARPDAAPPAPPTAEQKKIAKQLGDGIASELISDIQALGMPAAQATPMTQPRVNDIVVRGYLVSINKGSALKRMTIGFGAGGSELTTFVEVYQMTPTGLRKLGSGTVKSGGSKGPGAALGAAGWAITGNPVGLVVGGGLKIYGEASGRSTIEGRAKATAKEIADRFKVRMQEQGWIE